jgi:hypothetical protein
MGEVKLTKYPARILGDYMKVYFAEFPMGAVLQPPEGWAFVKVGQWRKGCQDECWRVVYRRAALSHTQAKGEE